MRWCPHCKRMVRGTKPLGVAAWLVIILLSGFTLGLFLFIFIPWFFLIKKFECPICRTTELLPSEPAAVSPRGNVAIAVGESRFIHCSQCGKQSSVQAKFCSGCGSPIVAPT